MFIKSAIAKAASGAAMGTFYVANLVGLFVIVAAWFNLGWPSWLIFVLGGLVFVFGLWEIGFLLGVVVTVACFVAGEWVWGIGIIAANLLLPWIALGVVALAAEGKES